MPEPGGILIRLHPCKGVVKPHQRTAEHRMVVGILAVPLFPCNSCTLVEPMAATGIPPFGHRPVGKVVQPVGPELLEKITCRIDAGVKVSAMLLPYFLGKCLDNILPV